MPALVDFFQKERADVDSRLGLPAGRARLRNRLSPFSTEWVVLAALVLHDSAPFPQLWTNLWKRPLLSLHNSYLFVVVRARLKGPVQAKYCIFRSSGSGRSVENTPADGYNEPVLLARAVHHP